jgi:hypothetical protein
MRLFSLRFPPDERASRAVARPAWADPTGPHAVNCTLDCRRLAVGGGALKRMSLNIPSTAARLHVRRQSLRGVPLVRVRSLRSSGARAPPPASKFAALDKLDVLGDGPQNTRRVVIDGMSRAGHSGCSEAEQRRWASRRPGLDECHVFALTASASASVCACAVQAVGPDSFTVNGLRISGSVRLPHNPQGAISRPSVLALHRRVAAPQADRRAPRRRPLCAGFLVSTLCDHMERGEPHRIVSGRVCAAEAASTAPGPRRPRHGS